MLKQLTKYIFTLFLIMIFISSCKFPYQPVIAPIAIEKEDNDIAEGIPVTTEDTITPLENDYFEDNYLRYQDYTYKKDIKSIIFEKASLDLSVPIIPLQSEEKLLLRFDDLSGKQKDYKYKIVLCDAKWNPIEAEPIEYIEGYQENYIETYDFSLNTIQSFVHYELLFPNENIRPKVSGNYVIFVYLNDGKSMGDYVLSRRFMVYEPLLNIDANVHPATLLDDRNYKQEIDFDIKTSGFHIDAPYRDLKVVIRKNRRWDNAIWDLKPSLVKGDILEYNYERENVFSGGNEYREVDIKSLQYQSININNIDYDLNSYNVYLLPDQRRSFKVYSTIKDINGKKYIKNEEAKYDSHLESEYVYVHFFLEYPQILVDGDIFVFGALSDWQLNDENKMKYNFDKKRYETSLYIKQGYYNYLYAFVENGEEVADVSFIEGQHQETENDYMILVYYKEPGSYFDRLVGIKFLNSLEYE
jgi:Type 9 secretion system plug protein 1st domain